MTAGFPALGDNNINAAVHGTACFLCRADRMQHDSAAVLGPRHKSSRILPEERDDRGTLFKTGCKALLLREVKVQIDPERPVCKRPRPAVAGWCQRRLATTPACRARWRC